MPKTSSKKLKGLSAKTKMSLYEEVYNIVVAIFVISLILSYNFYDPLKTFISMPRAFLAVLITFSLSLISQKLVARKLRCKAFYRLWLPGLVVSMLIMVVGVKPVILIGTATLSTYKFGRWGFKSTHGTMTELGWIGLSGPLANIVLAYILKLFTPFSYLAYVNAVFAFFNLMPVEPLDGAKLVVWNPVLWFLLMIILVLILTPSNILSYLSII